MNQNRLVFDCEANGLLDEVDKVWCISSDLIDQKEEIATLSIEKGIFKENLEELFSKPDIIIGHNIIGYDIPLLKKIFNFDLLERFNPEQIIDTYLLSQLLYPDRQMPKGCPTSIINPVTKKSKKIGPHSLEAWGWRCGERKIEIHDWTTFTKDIIDRCEIDVSINTKTYFKLMKEAGIL